MSGKSTLVGAMCVIVFVSCGTIQEARRETQLVKAPMATVFQAINATFFDLELTDVEGTLAEEYLRGFGEAWAGVGSRGSSWYYTARLFGADNSTLVKLEIHHLAGYEGYRPAYRDFWKLFNRNLKLLSAK